MSIQAEIVEKLADELNHGDGETLARVVIAMANTWMSAYQRGTLDGYHSAEEAISFCGQMAEPGQSFASADWLEDAMKVLEANKPDSRISDDLPF